MKTLKKIFFVIAGICLLLACSKPDEFFDDDPLGNILGCTDETVTVPFKTDFNYNYTSVGVDVEMCGEYPMLYVIADGAGTATHLGKFTTRVEFCVNSETSIFGEEGYTVGSFIAANGDELFYATWGKVEPRDENDPPNILEKWDAPFLFTGGTGRFEEASGEGIYHGYNILENEVVFCRAIYEGTLTLAKGNR